MNNNILKKILLSTLPLMAIGANAKAPQSINYQSVVRTVSGHVVANKIVYVKVEIIYDINGKNTTVYEETHTTNTNFNGSLAIKIGEGENPKGSFENINWEDGEYSIKTSTSTSEDMSDAAVAISSLSSVPYALYSLHSADSFSGFFNDLKGKPDMSKFVTVDNAPTLAADTMKKMLSNYATSDDVQDLFLRGVRTSNYRIDSLKAITASNRNLISKLESKDSVYVKSSDIALFVKKDTLSTYATKEIVNSLKKSTESAIAEQAKIIADNKALTNATFNDMNEIHKLYAKKDTMQFFMPKSGMSVYATTDALESANKSISSLSNSINNTNTKLSNLTTTVSTITTTVSDNKKETDKKVDAIQSDLNKVDDKIASSERKAKADDLVLENKISTNEKNISKLAKNDTLLESKFNNKMASLSAQLDSIDNNHSSSLDSLAKVTTSNATVSARNVNSKIDSLSKAINGQVNTLNTDLTKAINKEVTARESDIKSINNTLSEHSSVLATCAADLANINVDFPQLINFVNNLKAQNDSLANVITAQKAKHKADSTKLADKIAVLENKVETLTASNLSSTDVNALIQAALTAAGLNGLSATVNGLSSTVGTLNTDVTALKNTVNTATTGLKDRVTALETATADLTTLSSDVEALKTATSDLSTLTSDVEALKTATSGLNVTELNGKVDALEATVGNETSGLVKDVNGLKSESNDLSTLTSDVDDLKNKINDNDNGLINKVDGLNNAFLGLFSTIEELEEKVNGMIPTPDPTPDPTPEPEPTPEP